VEGRNFSYGQPRSFGNIPGTTEMSHPKTLSDRSFFSSIWEYSGRRRPSRLRGGLGQNLTVGMMPGGGSQCANATANTGFRVRSVTRPSTLPPHGFAASLTGAASSAPGLAHSRARRPDGQTGIQMSTSIASSPCRCCHAAELARQHSSLLCPVHQSRPAQIPLVRVRRDWHQNRCWATARLGLSISATSGGASTLDRDGPTLQAQVFAYDTIR